MNFIGSNSLGSIVAETSDAADNANSSYSISVGDTFSGTLSHEGDRDWVGITLTAGVSYLFKQGITAKTIVSLCLAFLLVCIQVLWKDGAQTVQ